MYIFIDDIRPNPDPTKYNKYKSVEEAIKIIKLIHPIAISTDYDLGKDKMDGLDLLKWLHENQIYPDEINIHSEHPTGAPEMEKYIKKYFPETVKLTKIKY